MGARASAEQDAYEAPTWLATHRTLIWIRTLAARDSLTATPIARTQAKSVQHAEDSEAESTKENQRNQGNTKEEKALQIPVISRLFE